MTLAPNGLANAAPYRWTYADATARTSDTGFTTADVGSLAYQESDGTLWILTATTPTWQAAAGGGTGDMLASNNLSDLADAATARTNLGLGTAATKNVPASGDAASGEAVLGNDTRLSDARTPAAHAASHHTGGSDALAAADIGAEPALGNPASDGQVLSSTAAGVRSWATPAVNPMTTANDLIVGGASGVPTRLAKGGNNTVLGVDGSGVLGYKADPTGGGGALTVIARIVVGAGGAATIDFSSIPSTYGAVRLTLVGRLTGAVGDASITVRLNNDSDANYDHARLLVFGTTITSDDTNAQTSLDISSLPGALAPSGEAGSIICELPAYAGTTWQKTVHIRGVSRTDTGTGNLRLRYDLGFWRSTAAINQLTLSSGSGNFAQGTIAALYGYTTS